MHKPKVQRIYTRITQELAIPTDNAYVDGKISNIPLESGDYTPESVSDLEKGGYIIDDSYSLLATRKAQVKKGHYEFRFLLPDTKDQDGNFLHPEKGVVKIGVADGSLVLDGSGFASVEGLEVSGGEYGASTLDVIAQLAREGSYFKIDAMYLDADDDRHYNSKMVERHWEHDGTSGAERNIFYPKASSNDNQTSIRSMADFNTYLDGFSYLEMPVRRGIGVNVTISTEYAK